MNDGVVLPWLIFSLGVALKLWQAVRLGRHLWGDRRSIDSWNLERVRASLERTWRLE